MKAGKVTRFERNIIYNAVTSSHTKRSINSIYSGMVIIRNTLLKKISPNYKNFEMSFYPMVIKKYKCKFERISGFWYSIDNMKDLAQLSIGDLQIKLIKLFKKLS